MSTLTVNEIRSKFLNYMKEKGHAVVPSASLVPENDPTTLFTGSGMQPMLPYLLGQPHPLGKRIADSQKSFRSGDIEEVGDNRHTTFFEMLGNWSFGDYFKEEEINWVWTFLIEELKLDPKNFYVTCFKGSEELGLPKDEDSVKLWQPLFEKVGISFGVGENAETEGMKEGERIFYYSEKKNWWSRSGVPQNMPEGEPGGPDSEMFYDFDPDLKKEYHARSAFYDEPCHVNCDCGRFLEIGNNVFMQYKKTANGFEELPQMNVDHGSGLERYVAALRNDSDIFNIDVFDGPRKTLEVISNQKYGANEKTTYAMRVVMDHIRSATFLIGDGVIPGNKDQSYFVRRLIRRAVRYANEFGLAQGKNSNKSDLSTISEMFIRSYMAQYPNLATKADFILNEIENEEKKFRTTLEKGMRQFEKIITSTINGSMETKTLSYSSVFELVTTHGFPIELVQEIATERGLVVDMMMFEANMEEHKALSRTASAGKFKGGLGGDGEMETKYHTATHMLHQALRTVLGDTVVQKGSNITPERLRFDFAYGEKMTDEQKKQVEDLINAKIQESLPVIREEVSIDEARARGAMGLFTDKYGDKVSIYRIGDLPAQAGGKKACVGDDGIFSIEMCGGPHVENIGALGVFKIVKEEAVSAGVRRIKAVLE